MTRLLLWLYPRAWRERYGDELMVLVDTDGLSGGTVIDLARGAVREQAHAFVSGEKRGFFEHVFVVLGLTGISWLLSRLVFGVTPIKAIGVVVLAPQYVAPLALVRVVVARPTRSSRGIRIRGSELMAWSIVAVMCGAILQAPWLGPFSSNWQLGRVRFGFGSAFNIMGGMYFILAVWRGHRWPAARWGSFA